MGTSERNCFKDMFPKNHRPEIDELDKFWNNGAEVLFREFAEHLLQNYNLRFGIPVWSETYGWRYRIGRSGVYLIQGIQIVTYGFIVEDILVFDKASYSLLLERVRDIYEKSRREFQAKIEEKNKRQLQRNQKRIKREREEYTAIQNKIIPEKYNVFHWPDKLDVQKLKRLYMLDAKGIQDMELADDVGLTLYLRCKYGKEDGELMEKYLIRCHNCGRELSGEEDFRQCACGYQYSFREYRRSYRKNNMPAGAAAKIFEGFMIDWSKAKDYEEKIIIMDKLLHEFHLSLISGAVHRPVAMNFMDGTRQKVEKVIHDLARR